MSLKEEQLKKLIEIDKNYALILDSKGIKDLTINFNPGQIQLTGQLAKTDISGKFNLKLKPTGFYWQDDKHIMKCKIIKSTIKFDKKTLKGILACLAFPIAKLILGNEKLFDYMGIEHDESEILLRFDNVHQLADLAIQKLELIEYYCESGKMTFAFKFKPNLKFSELKDIYALTKDFKPKVDGVVTSGLRIFRSDIRKIAKKHNLEMEE